MGKSRKIDISSFDTPDGQPPAGKSARLARFLGEIVSAASMMPAGEVQLSPLRCRRRPNRRACCGHIEVGLDAGSEDVIRWQCNTCGDQGVITNWRHTRWDLGPELRAGRVVSLSHARARRARRRGDASRANVYDLVVELIDGPIALENMVSRRVRISGQETVHQLHRLICDAFDRDPDEAYELMFGAPYEPDAHRLTGAGEPDAEDSQWPTETFETRIDELDLECGKIFGYLYDFDAEWVHRVTVVAAREQRPVAPMVVERYGDTPLMGDDEDFAEQIIWQELDDDYPLSDLYGPYDGNHAPDAEAWLAMEELERLLLIVEAHAQEAPTAGQQTPDPGLLHAVVHEAAETALVTGVIEQQALDELIAGGLSRHEALHCLGRRIVLDKLASLELEAPCSKD